MISSLRSFTIYVFFETMRFDIKNPSLNMLKKVHYALRYNTIAINDIQYYNLKIAL